MAAGSTGSSLVATRYATAFLDMTAESGSVEQAEKDLSSLEAMIAESDDLRFLIENPLVGRDRQQRAILALAEQAKFQPLTRNFLGMIAANRRLDRLPAILAAFRRELMRRRGAVEAKVQTAAALTPAQTEALRSELAQAMGAHVTLDVSVDKSLLGGMVVTVGSRMIDNSVKRKLEMLQRAMSAPVNTATNGNEHASKEVG